MKRVLAVFWVLLFAGCDADSQKNDFSSALPVAANYFSKSTIYFPDGAGLQFSGKLRRYELVENEKGLFDRYTFEFSEDMMAIEGAVFATLAKSGYQRKVRREDDRLYVVNYIKKGFAPVSMTYERMPAKKKVQAFTRLRVVWKKA